jgi:hypothetical protein
MPNIDELKTNKSGFVPTLKQLSQEEEPTLPPRMSAGISQGQSTVSYNGGKRSNAVKSGGMSFAKKPKMPAKEDRVEADFSSLPKTRLDETAGVDLRTSIEDDIFHEGGPFDQYLENKKKEYQEDMEKYEQALEAKKLEDEEKAELENDPDNGKILEFDNSDRSDVDTNITQTQSYRSINLQRREKPMREENYNKEEQLEESNNSQQQYYYDEDNEEVEEDENDIYYSNSDDAVNDEPQEQHYESYPDATERIEDEVVQEPAKVEQATPVNNNTHPVKPTPIAAKVAKVARTYMAIEDEVSDEDDDGIVEITEDDDQLNGLKALISQKIKPVTKKLDLDSFTIARKGTTSNNILQTESAAVAKWVLPNTGIVVQMREISGANMELIRSHLDRSPVPNIRGALKVIYDHIVSPKPDSFETWMKSVAYADYDNLFMAAYIASFSEANYLPIDCQNTNCRKAYLTDNIDIMSMVKFNNTESENKFWNLYNSDIVNGNGLYVSKVTPISDKFAVAFKEPSLYNTMIESGYFSSDFSNKYSNTIAYLPYIDEIYFIDAVNRSLVPIDYKKYDNNISRTARSKVIRYSNVLNTLNADQNSIITAHVNAINERINWFTYQIPETTCPECGFQNPAITDQTASSLLFLRNRLAVLATI